MEKLALSVPWALRGPLPIIQFGTNNADPPLMPSTLGLGVEFEFESSNFCMWRGKKEIKAVELNILDFKIIASLKILADAVPRNRFSRIEIPFRDEKMFSFVASAGSLSASSGQFSLEVCIQQNFYTCGNLTHFQNNPTHAVIFMVKENAEDPFENPLELASNSCGTHHFHFIKTGYL